jgi:hypothetical protein
LEQLLRNYRPREHTVAGEFPSPGLSFLAKENLGFCYDFGLIFGASFSLT